MTKSGNEMATFNGSLKDAALMDIEVRIQMHFRAATMNLVDEKIIMGFPSSEAPHRISEPR